MPIVGPEAGLFNVEDPLASRVGYAGLDSMGYAQEDLPLGYQLLGSLPSASVTTAWNLGRVRNTIFEAPGVKRSFRKRVVSDGIYNGSYYNYDYNGLNRGVGKSFSLRPGGGIKQTLLQPRRLQRAANIDPSAYGAKTKIYSPFNFLSSMGNTAFNKFGDEITKFGGETLASAMGSSPRAKGEKMFAPGTLGRIMTGSQISSMSTEKLGKRAFSIRTAIHDLNPAGYDDFAKGLQAIEGMGDDAAKFYYRAGIEGTIGGRISGRFAGHIAGMEAAYRGEAAVAGLRASGGNKYYMEAAEKAISKVGSGTKLGFVDKMVAKGAVGGALRGANIAGWVVLAHDIALGAGRIVGAGLKTAIEGGRSMMGSIDKGIMGMGFKDNTVAATSRQRGVMAISNSRLNARSLLGSEGAMMHAHFG